MNIVSRIVGDIRARRDFFAETPGHDHTGKGWYCGGNLLDVDEYDVGAGFDRGPVSVHVKRCTCGDWGVSVYIELPSVPGECRRVWAQLDSEDRFLRPRYGYERYKRQRTHFETQAQAWADSNPERMEHLRALYANVHRSIFGGLL